MLVGRGHTADLGSAEIIEACVKLFPVFFQTNDLHVVVFGGGETARRKVRLLAKTDAIIDVISSKFEGVFVEEFAGRVGFGPWDLAEDLLSAAKFAIIAADSEAELNLALTLCRENRLPINVVDRPDLCDFTIPSIIDRGTVVAGIATGGASPIIAKTIRARLESLMPQRIGDLADFARTFRPAVSKRFPDEAIRRQFWESVLRGPIAEKVLAGDEAGARNQLTLMLEDTKDPVGAVHIVGAGPGDPELLTLKALRILQDADIVFYDFLVGDGVLDLVRRDAERVPVGKRKGYHSVPQDQIHALMVEAARAGKCVVRLKGGDPFIFGRGGEELYALRAEGIEAQIVPGISSALGCAASAGIPLTHRDHAQSVTLVTGHAQSGNKIPDLDWNALARANQTVVVYMGVDTASVIRKHLMAAGRSGNTPVAVIENGTRDNEIRAFGRLSDLADLIITHGIRGPALLFIGETAGLTPEAIAAAKAQLESAA